VQSIAAADYTAYAVNADGTVWAWGEDNNGELGNGALVDSQTPVQVSGLTAVSSVTLA
jgi:alpha-tubulin suppressor-like RCC1 family protein